MSMMTSQIFIQIWKSQDQNIFSSNKKIITHQALLYEKSSLAQKIETLLKKISSSIQCVSTR